MKPCQCFCSLINACCSVYLSCSLTQQRIEQSLHIDPGLSSSNLVRQPAGPPVHGRSCSVVRVATLRWKLQTELSISPRHRILRPSQPFPALTDRLVGLVVRRPPLERKIPGSNPACAGIFSGSSHTSDFKIGTPLATLPGAWRYRVSAETGRPGVSIL